MLWYNIETGMLQSNSPAGGWRTESYMRENYPSWVQVDDDFQSPIRKAGVIEPTKDEKLATLNTEYESSKQELANAYLDAILHNDKDMANSIKAEIAALDKKYDSDYAKIEKEV